MQEGAAIEHDKTAASSRAGLLNAGLASGGMEKCGEVGGLPKVLTFAEGAHFRE
jgi:hypothetical protein